MKKSLALLLALIMVFALATTAVANADDDPLAGLDPIEIVFATPNADANIESEYAQKWIAAVEEASGGKITFDYTNSGALGTYDELLQGTINGIYDMTITEPSYIATYVPESAVLSLPMLFSSYDEADWVFDGDVGTWYNGLCKAAGMEILNLDLLAGLFDSGSSEFHRMITMVYRFEAYGAIPLGINAAVLALLYGLGKTKLTLVLNFSRVFLFRIPVFWFLQNYTDLGEASVGIVMMVSNISVTVMAVSVAAVVIARFRKEYLS